MLCYKAAHLADCVNAACKPLSSQFHTFSSTACLLGDNSVDDDAGTGICWLVMLLIVASKLPATKHFAAAACI